jgi:hypothetical protein
MVIVIILILIMSKFGFKDEVLIKLIFGVVKHVTMSPLLSLDRLTIEAAIDFYRHQLRRESQ